jgi:Fe-Mn family superoxide dismutase
MLSARKPYVLPDLPYGYTDLAPFISEEQLRIHHTKHHRAYVDNANALLDSLDKARNDNADADFGTIAKQISFNTGGHRLHSLFWKNLAKPKTGNMPDGKIAKVLTDEFGSFERFKKEFSQVALKAEGSGWAVLSFCPEVRRPILMQVEKHNVNITPKRPVIMVLDVWEHAYYLDYKNDRAKFIEGFWNIVNWAEVNKRLEELL